MRERKTKIINIVVPPGEASMKALPEKLGL